MLDRSGEYLSLFTKDIVVDKKLPKWSTIKSDIDNEISKKRNLKSSSENETSLMYNYMIDVVVDEVAYDDIVERVKKISDMSITDFNIMLGLESLKYSNIMSWSEDGFVTEVKKEDTKKDSIFRKLVRIFRDGKKEDVASFDVISFFSKIKGGLSSEKSYEDYATRIAPYIVAIKNAEMMGQTSLLDKLISNVYREKYESILYSKGFLKKISEKQVVEFAKKTEKGVSLTYVKNFSRPIPLDVMKKKADADKLMIFDNYVILHYDPKEKAVAKTNKEKKQEREKKSDPILFGIIKGSTDLYYIADWVDDYCDLTIEEFMKVCNLSEKDIIISETIDIQ